MWSIFVQGVPSPLMPKSLWCRVKYIKAVLSWNYMPQKIIYYFSLPFQVGIWPLWCRGHRLRLGSNIYFRDMSELQNSFHICPSHKWHTCTTCRNSLISRELLLGLDGRVRILRTVRIRRIRTNLWDRIRLDPKPIRS